jgi:hypothetical protein
MEMAMAQAIDAAVPTTPGKKVCPKEKGEHGWR